MGFIGLFLGLSRRASGGSPPVAPLAINKSLGDAGGGTVITIQVTASAGITSAKVCGGSFSVTATDGTHVQGTTIAMTASATPGNVTVSNSSGESPALTGVFEAFAPSNITSPALLIDLESDKGVTQTSGSISAWADQSSNHYDAASNVNPTLTASVFNGHPGVTGDGATTSMSLAAQLVASGCHMFLIGKSGVANSVLNGAPWKLGAGSGGYMCFGGDIYENCGNTARPNGTPPDLTSPFRYEVKLNPGVSYDLLVNGASVLHDTTDTTLGWEVVPHIMDNRLGNSYNGNVGAIFGWVAPLSAPQLARVNAWILDKWGIS